MLAGESILNNTHFLMQVGIVVVNGYFLFRILTGRETTGDRGNEGYSSFPEGQSEHPYQGQGGVADEGGAGGQYRAPEY